MYSYEDVDEEVVVVEVVEETVVKFSVVATIKGGGGWTNDTLWLRKVSVV